jgi:hypothetical protein
MLKKLTKHPGLLTFGLTTAILVPAGLSQLHAGKAEVARLVRPGATTFVLDGATINMTTDSVFIDAHGVVHVALTATAPTPRDVKVAVLVEETRGSSGGRVEDPPEMTAQDEITLHATPDGGKPQTLAYRLAGYLGETMEGSMQYGHYTILAMAPQQAHKLDRLQRKATPGGGEFWQLYYDLRNNEADVARIEVNTRTEDKDFQLEFPRTVHAGEPFTVTVRLKNTGPKVDKLMAILHTPSLGADYLGLQPDDVALGDDGGQREVNEPTKTNQVRVFTYQVTALKPGLLGLEARAENENGATLDTALDAIEVLPAAVARTE